jgi:phosphatidylglycerol:prolipoprotein diacylglycerol transferase
VSAVIGFGLAAGVVAGLPYFDVPTLGPLQPFGMIVAVGVLVGAWVMRVYAEKRGVDDDDLRGLTGWITVTGFIGAHVFDVLVYNQAELEKDPLILLKLWQGISSYGGFIGGTLGYLFFCWWKRLIPLFWSDTGLLGLLVAFSIGRIGCTIVHDHVGTATTFFLGFDYPREALHDRGILDEFASNAPVIRAWNLGLMELLYLIPVNILVLWVAFKGKPRPIGFLTVIIGGLYAPVRFVLEFARHTKTDPLYFGLTFAQWCSIFVFVLCGYFAYKIAKYGKPHPFKEELGGIVGGKKVTLEQLAKRKEAEAKEGGAPKKDKKKKKGEKKDEKKAAEVVEKQDDAEKADEKKADEKMADEKKEDDAKDEKAAE